MLSRCRTPVAAILSRVPVKHLINTGLIPTVCTAMLLTQAVLAAPAMTGKVLDAFEDGVSAFDRGDHGRALALWAPLARRGVAAAQNNLAVMYDHGFGVEEDDFEAFKWYRKAAEQGNAQAQYSLALMYNNGHGVGADHREAARWYRRAAEQGDANAMYHMALVYDFGHGVVEDDAEAARWYRRAADVGDARAQYNLGLLYDFGNGVAQDHGAAVRWYRRAAEQGDARAQYTLAASYFAGEGVARSDVMAYAWMTLAASQGHVRARQGRATVWHRMSVDEQQRARQMHRQLADAVALRKRIEMPRDTAVEALVPDLVRETQRALAERGYDPGPADGVLGPATTDALRRFQRDAGLSETGQPSAALLRFIRIPGVAAAR